MKKIETIIFDMDGTLYQIDGQTTGFVGSSLEVAILHNALAYIQEYEDCTVEVAQAVLTEALADPVGVSRFLSQKYQIKRVDYLNQVWQVSPTEVVQNFEAAVNIVKRLKEKNARLILLTSAPAIWQQIVCSFIGVLNEFDEIYTAEMFSSKEEVFLQLATRYEPATILSVGDQLATDIKPAQQFGIQTLWIQSPADLEKILTNFKDEDEKNSLSDRY